MATQASERETSGSQGERRRSQRVPLVRRVEIAWHQQDGNYIKGYAETEDVSPHGALLRMKERVSMREVVALNHGRASNWTLARVLRCNPPGADGWTLVAIELAVPSPTFWGVWYWAGV